MFALAHADFRSQAKRDSDAFSIPNIQQKNYQLFAPLVHNNQNIKKGVVVFNDNTFYNFDKVTIKPASA